MAKRILLNLKKIDDVISNFNVSTTKEVESRYFFVFKWIKLKFGVRSNIIFLTSKTFVDYCLKLT